MKPRKLHTAVPYVPIESSQNVLNKLVMPLSSNDGLHLALHIGDTTLANIDLRAGLHMSIHFPTVPLEHR